MSKEAENRELRNLLEKSNRENEKLQQNINALIREHKRLIDLHYSQ